MVALPQRRRSPHPITEPNQTLECGVRTMPNVTVNPASGGGQDSPCEDSGRELSLLIQLDFLVSAHSRSSAGAILVGSRLQLTRAKDAYDGACD